MKTLGYNSLPAAEGRQGQHAEGGKSHHWIELELGKSEQPLDTKLTMHMDGFSNGFPMNMDGN